MGQLQTKDTTPAQTKLTRRISITSISKSRIFKAPEVIVDLPSVIPLEESHKESLDKPVPDSALPLQKINLDVACAMVYQGFVDKDHPVDFAKYDHKGNKGKYTIRFTLGQNSYLLLVKTIKHDTQGQLVNQLIANVDFLVDLKKKGMVIE